MVLLLEDDDDDDVYIYFILSFFPIVVGSTLYNRRAGYNTNKNRGAQHSPARH